MSVRQLIDSQPMSTLQIRVVGLCFFLNMLDGMDVLAISFAAPLITAQWSMNPGALGIVFSAALIGMTIGAVLIAPYTDRIGRKKMIVGSLCVICLGMFATAFSANLAQLVFTRLLAGLGIGAMLASLTSMVSEYASNKHRNFCIVLLQAGYPVGAMITGFIAAWLLPRFGWQPLFIFAALVSLISLPLVIFLLPESLDFLESKQPANALKKVNSILAKMGLSALHLLPDSQKQESGVKLKLLLGAELKKQTLLLWLSFFMAFATLYFLLSWVVQLAVKSGLSVENAIYAGTALNLGAFFGGVTLAWLSSRVGLRKIIAVYFILGAVMIVLYGAINTSVGLTLLMIFVLMYFIQGAFIALYAIAARLYPTAYRTTGIGWAIGAGRIGAILGPAIAGFLLGAGLSISWTFACFSLPVLIAAMSVMGISNDNIS